MKNRILKLLKYGIILIVILVSGAVFTPRSYDVPPLQNRKNIRFWNLKTGSRIAYTTLVAKGNKIPYPIIYLHGGPGGPITNRNIQMLLPLTENGFDVYLYDQIGGGHSARLADIKEYTADRHTRDLAEIIKRIGSEKVILIGQSWGAILAVLYTADHLDKVEKLILTGPGPIVPVRQKLRDLKAPDSLHLNEPYYSNRQGNKKAHHLRSKAILWWAETFGRKLASDREADNFATHLNNELNKSTVCDTAKILKAVGGGGFYVQVMTVKSFSEVPDPRPKLRNSPIPVLVMKGQCDNQKWGFTSEYLDLFPNHQLAVIPNAGHAIAVEQPELYLKTIRDFVTQ